MSAPLPTPAEKRRAEMLVDASVPRAYRLDQVETDVLDPLEQEADLSKRPVDAKMVERMARLYMESAEIAAVIEMPLEQFEVLYGPVVARGRAQALVDLRRKRWQVAMRGNVQMLLHLSRQLLDEKPPVNVNANLNVNVDASKDDDPRELLRRAVEEATLRLRSGQVKALPSAEVLAPGAEF